MLARVTQIVAPAHRDLQFCMHSRDVKSSFRPKKNWPRPRPRDYWSRPHDSCGIGLVQLGLVVFEVPLKCFVTLTLEIRHFLLSVLIQKH